MKVSALLGDHAELSIPFPGGAVSLAYRPNILVPSYRNRPDLSITQALADVVKEWDLEAEDGAPVALDVDAINAAVPAEMQFGLWMTILGDLRPNLMRTPNSPPS